MDGTFLRPDGTYDQERLDKLLPQLTDAGYPFV
ncbi:Cof-type HAD-IIB family hydrolase, partial [Streptococcus hyovaginalis]